MIDHFLLFSNSKITTHNTLAYTLFELRLAKEYTSLNEAYYHYLHAANPAKKWILMFHWCIYQTTTCFFINYFF